MLTPLSLLALIPFAYSADDIDFGNYLIRDDVKDDIFISFNVQTYGVGNAVFHDGYFVIDGYVMNAHQSDITSVNNSDRTLSILGKTTTNEQFVIIFDKQTNNMTYEFWIDGEQFRDEITTRIDIL